MEMRWGDGAWPMHWATFLMALLGDIHTMKKLSLFTAVTISAYVSNANAQGWTEGAHFFCEVKSVQSLTDSGVLHVSEWNKVQRASPEFEAIYFNAGSGELRFRNSDTTWQYQVVQKASADNSLKAVRVYNGIADTVVQFLKIQTFEESMPFILIDDEIITGNCKRN